MSDLITVWCNTCAKIFKQERPPFLSEFFYCDECAAEAMAAAAKRRAIEEMSEAELEAARIRDISLQIAAIEKGQLDAIGCPYCGQINQRGETLCCELLSMAVWAVLEHKSLEEQKRQADQIAEQISKN